jgi:ATP-dependent Clp protease ATP-binding subunit ClpA
LYSGMPANVSSCLTEEGQKVIDKAEAAARELKHGYLGTEHILLGLVRVDDGVAARVLESLDITVERVRAQVVRIVGTGEEEYPCDLPLTPRARKAMDFSWREARSLGTREIKSGHILLGLVRENEGVAASILLDFGADAEKVRDAVIRAISSSGQPPVAPPTPPRVPITPSVADAVMQVTVPPGVVLVLKSAQGHRLHSTPKRGGTELQVRAKRPGLQPR